MRGGGRFHGSLTCARKWTAKEWHLQQIRLIISRTTVCSFADNERSLWNFREKVLKARDSCPLILSHWDKKGRNPITVLIIGKRQSPSWLPITTLARLRCFGRRPKRVNATVVLCNIPLRGSPTILLLSRLSDSLRREISVVTSLSVQPFIPPEMKQIL